MDNGKAINLEREVPELARAVAVVRADRGIEARLERMVCEVVRVVAGMIFVAWGVGCASLAAFAGSIGCVVAAAIVLANAAIIRLMARHAPSILSEDSDEADSESAMSNVSAGPVRLLILVVSFSVFLPSVAICFRWYADAALRQFDEKRAKANAVVADPRWSSMCWLFATLERRNELAKRGVGLDDGAAAVEVLLEETKGNTHLRPLGRAHLPLSAAFLKNVAALESVTDRIELDANEAFLFGTHRDRVD